MSSKSRGGLSKREMAAKQAGGNLNYKTNKISVRSVPKASKSSSSSKSSAYTGPYAPGYAGPKQSEYSTPVKASYYSGPYSPTYTGKRQEGYDQPVKRSSPGHKSSSQIRKEANDRRALVTPNQRDLAAAAIGRNDGRLTNIKSSDAFSRSGNLTNTSPTSLGKLLQVLSDPTGMLKGQEKPDLGLTEMLGINNWLRTPTAYAANNELINTQEPVMDQPYFEPNTNPDVNANYDWNNDLENRKYAGLDYDARARKNELIGMGEDPNAIEDNLSNAPRVAGEETTNFGNQLAYGNTELPNLGDFGGKMDVGDEQQTGMDNEKYFKEDEKDLKKGRSSAQKALESLIAQTGAEGQQKLNEDKGQALGQLASLFAAYGTSDSEQRMQQQQRMNTDYAGKLATFLSSLANQKAQGTNDINQSYNTARSALNKERRDAAFRVQELMRQAANDSFDRKYKMAQLGRSNMGDIRNSLADLASGWTSGLSDPYSRQGGREVIGQQLASLYGGNSNQYSNMLPNGWEGLYATPPKSNGQPQLERDPVTGQWGYYVDEY